MWDAGPEAPKESGGALSIPIHPGPALEKRCMPSAQRHSLDVGFPWVGGQGSLILRPTAVLSRGCWQRSRAAS